MSTKKTHMELGERLKTLKNFWRLSQKEMAERLEIAISTYQYYERGERDVPGKVLTLITSFGVSPVWLLTGNGPMLQTDIIAATPTEKIGVPMSLEPLEGIDDKTDEVTIAVDLEDSSFSGRLKILIKDRLNISQSDFCEKLGLTSSYLSMIIKGKRGPSANLITGVYLYYREHFHWLVTGTEEQESRKGHEVPYFDPVVNDHMEIVKRFKHKELAKKINESMLKIDSVETLERLDFLVKGMALGMRCEVTFVENSTTSNQNHFSEGNLKNGTEE